MGHAAVRLWPNVRAQVSVVAALLENGFDPDQHADDGVYPLGLAAFRGNLPIVRLLLKYGAGVDSRTPRGVTALQTSVCVYINVNIRDCFLTLPVFVCSCGTALELNRPHIVLNRPGFSCFVDFPRH